MAKNTSILAAFERMWYHVTNALSKKADKEHEHDDTYNKTEVDILLSNKSDSDHNHDGRYEEKGASDGILTNANAYTDSKLDEKADAEHTHEMADITDLSSQLNTKVPATRKINDKALDADIALSAADVGADASGSAANALNESKAYTDTEVAKKATPAQIDSKIAEHNVDTAAHNDIRISLNELTTKVNNFLDVDDTTTDQLSELLTLISENADDIEAITNGKVNVSDIIDNLTTNVNNKPLSAAQGVVLKGLIDNLNAALGTKASTDDLNTLEEKVDSNWENTYQYKVDRSANTFLAAPNGSNGFASFRRLTGADLPDSRDWSRSLGATLNALGWYRIYTSAVSSSSGGSTVNFTLSHNYSYSDQEVYDFSVSVGYSGQIDITQISGVRRGGAISKIRVVHSNSGAYYYIDFYYGTNSRNTCYVHGSGCGTFYAPTAATVPDGYSTYEFDTTTGCKSSGGFTGNLNGNASTATKAIQDGNGNTITSTYQPLESTSFAHINDTYISVRTPSRTANQYYEFWDSVGWADIHAGKVVAHVGFEGNLNGNAASADYASEAGQLRLTLIGSDSSGIVFTLDEYLTHIENYINLSQYCHRVWQHTWSYAGHGVLAATVGSHTHYIQLAGATCEIIGNRHDVYTLKIVTATTQGTSGADFILGATYQYNSHGSGYNPTWKIDCAVTAYDDERTPIFFAYGDSLPSAGIAGRIYFKKV